MRIRKFKLYQSYLFLINTTAVQNVRHFKTRKRRNNEIIGPYKCISVKWLKSSRRMSPCKYGGVYISAYESGQKLLPSSRTTI